MVDLHPTRLQLARELSGMTRAVVAREIGKSGESLRKMETGDIDFAPYLDTLANILDVPTGFFQGHPVDLLRPDDLSFRSLKSMPAKTRERTKCIATVCGAILFPTIDRLLAWERVNFPSETAAMDCGRNPERAAQCLRTTWMYGDGPISNLLDLCEQNGVRVFWYSDYDCKSYGVSFWYGGEPFILLNSTPASRQRQAFTLAHELGHLMLHRDVPLSDPHREQEANLFAGAFLLPKGSYSLEAPRYAILQEFLSLKRKWCTSVGTMVMRNAALGIFSPWQKETAFKEMSVLGWKKSEPGDLPAPQSLAHIQAFDMLERSGIQPEDLAGEAGVTLELLEELMPVARDLKKVVGQWSLSELTAEPL